MRNIDKVFVGLFGIATLHGLGYIDSDGNFELSLSGRMVIGSDSFGLIGEFEVPQKLKAGQTAVKKKTRDGKAAAPAIEREECGDGCEQPDPDQAGNEIDPGL